MNYIKTYNVQIPIRTVYNFKIVEVATKETDPEKIMDEAIAKFYGEIGNRIKNEPCIINVDILEDNNKKEFIERI